MECRTFESPLLSGTREDDSSGHRCPTFFSKGATDMAAKKEVAAKKVEAKKPAKSAKAKPAAKKK